MRPLLLCAGLGAACFAVSWAMGAEAPLPLAPPVEKIVLPLPAAAETEPAPAAGIHDFTLENGLRVVVLTQPNAPAVTHMLWFRVGATDDTAGRSGLAHYVEHLMFQGTDAHKPGEYFRTIMRLGGEKNAFTNSDFTVYHATIAKPYLPKVMELEADRIQHLNPPQTAFAKEREVIIEERRQRVEVDPGARLREEVDAALFLNHPYHRPVIGWHDEMMRLTREDVVAFQKAWYAPNNATLILGGPISEEEARVLANRYYGSIPKRELPPRIEWSEPTAKADQSLTFRDAQVREPAYQQAWITPSVKDGVKVMLPYFVLSGVMGEGNRSRLYRSLVVEKHLATEAGSDYSGLLLGPGRMVTYAVPTDRTAATDAKVRAALQAEMEAVLKQLATTPPSAEEMARVKTQLKSIAVYGMDGAQGATELLGQLVMLGLPPDYLTQWPNDIDAVTPESVRDAAARLLHTRRLDAWMLPDGSAPTAPGGPVSILPKAIP